MFNRELALHDDDDVRFLCRVVIIIMPKERGRRLVIMKSNKECSPLLDLDHGLYTNLILFTLLLSIVV